MAGLPLDWVYGLLGGLMIGAAAALYLLVNGRVLGAAGILGGLVDGSERANARERLFFLAGLIGLPLIVALTAKAPETHVTSNVIVLITAGLLTGLGTRLANGCTSGHGVVGVARFSTRSIVAVICFVGAGMLTLYALRHLWGMI